jgi:SH3 domain-containing YSC84-like protein 1
VLQARLMKKTIMAALAMAAMAANASGAISSSEASRLEAAARVAQDIHNTIPQEYWDKARCVAVIPDLKKAAFIVGGEYGKGVMSCRTGVGWSAPLFVQLAKGSWGFQAGAEQVDVVMLIVNESGVLRGLDRRGST